MIPIYSLDPSTSGDTHLTGAGGFRPAFRGVGADALTAGASPGGAGLGDVSAESIAAVRNALASGRRVGADPDVIAKATTQGWSVSTGAVGLLLEPRLINLFPVLSPIRNWMSRHGAPNGATAVQWRAITAINTASLKAGVADGLRNSVVSTAERDRTQSFKSFGYDDFVTFDAQDSAANIYDLRAEASANLLAAVMATGEEPLILGGNVTATGAPAGLAAVDAAAAVAGPLTASTAYDFAVSALTQAGYSEGSTGHGTADAPDESTGATLTTYSTASGRTATTLSWSALRGAVAYNIFIGTHGGTLYYAFTTTATKVTVVTAAGAATIAGAPSTYPASTVGTPVVVATLPSSGHVPNTGDQTADALAFDGLIPQFEANAGSQYYDATAAYQGGGYFADLKGGTYTSDGGNGIVELDAALKSLWDTSRIGPTRIYVNSQEAESWGKLIVQAGAGVGTYRWMQQVNADGSVTGGLVADSYRNKFTSPRIIPIEIHPYLAPGTVLLLSERLPFPRANVPSAFQLEVLREYTQYDWAQVQRRWEFGIYARECLKVYFPAGCGAIVGNTAS